MMLAESSGSFDRFAYMVEDIEPPDPRTWTGQRDRALSGLMYNTGARVSEVIGLPVGDIVIGRALTRQGTQGTKRAALAINHVADLG